MSDPEVIYLQPECCADPEVGRLWCEDDAPADCEDGKPWTKYVLAARAAPAQPLDPEVGSDCNVCGRGVRYGERHSKCGEAVMALEAEVERLKSHGEEQELKVALWMGSSDIYRKEVERLKAAK